MSSKNFVLLIGNVGSVDIKEYTKDGETLPLVQVSIATSDGYKTKSGEWKNIDEWHRCILAIPALAERAKSINVGDKIEVTGSIKTNKWTDKEGNEKSMKEISVVSYKTWKKAQKDESSQTNENEVQNNNSSTSSDDDDLPF